ncbi:type II toxin-antitoxin system VapC family toxin [Candidatus Micrarchaeota archaeon]|nr:type II toxin-antitoxin system VapC family toxin [Candidatus Micrarchaeota archaeon]
MNVLDTTLLIEISRGTSVGKEVLDSLRGKETVVTSVSYYEFLRGTKKQDAVAFLDLFYVLQVGKTAARVASELFKSLQGAGVTLSTPDALIAGVCIANDATLHTMDGDFSKIKGLKLKLY